MIATIVLGLALLAQQPGEPDYKPGDTVAILTYSLAAVDYPPAIRLFKAERIGDVEGMVELGREGWTIYVRMGTRARLLGYRPFPGSKDEKCAEVRLLDGEGKGKVWFLSSRRLTKDFAAVDARRAEGERWGRMSEKEQTKAMDKLFEESQARAQAEARAEAAKEAEAKALAAKVQAEKDAKAKVQAEKDAAARDVIRKKVAEAEAAAKSRAAKAGGPR